MREFVKVPKGLPNLETIKIEGNIHKKIELNKALKVIVIPPSG